MGCSLRTPNAVANCLSSWWEGHGKAFLQWFFCRPEQWVDNEISCSIFWRLLPPDWGMSLIAKACAVCSPCRRQLDSSHLAHRCTVDMEAGDQEAMSGISDGRAVCGHSGCPIGSACRSRAKLFVSVDCWSAQQGSSTVQVQQGTKFYRNHRSSAASLNLKQVCWESILSSLCRDYWALE